MARKAPYVQEYTPAPSSDGHQSRGRDSLPTLPRQRRRRMVVIGMLLVLAGALSAAYLYTGIGDRTAVVMVARDVSVGSQITVSDVATTQVDAGQGVSLIPGRQLQQVVGRVAAVDLHKGTLLAPSQVTTELSPRPGQQVVPVALKASQLPARGLAPGDQVLVIAAPGQQGQDPAAPGTRDQLTQDTAATVDRVSAPDAEGSVRVDLVVDARVGPAIAKQASTGRLAVVVTSRRPQ
ncbi:SAF domain-containing protein [Actinomadura pelletieri DSM 43383]|uniref:SAF domain-containing protein n=2 Tax=Actinomadura pelletieri TaxID=111805 RepID=A0A495QX47_9ACTN|nr:SAF domain-containing protein [Actinomadura pelletieri DSM 43383]